MNEKTITYNGKKNNIKIGNKYNRLEILDLFMEKGKLYAKCKCDCNTIVDKVCVTSLLSENTKSCGCLNKELTIKRNLKHGEKTRGTKNRLYNIWADMRKRCNNQNRKDAKNYLQKGIKVCEEWNDFSNFKKWAIKNGYNDNLTIERIDNSKNYCPENCKWISRSEQSKNRTTNHYITFNNQTKTLTDWAKEIGINRTTLNARLKRGWSIEKALTTPPIIN